MWKKTEKTGELQYIQSFVCKHELTLSRSMPRLRSKEIVYMSVGGSE